MSRVNQRSMRCSVVKYQRFKSLLSSQCRSSPWPLGDSSLVSSANNRRLHWWRGMRATMIDRPTSVLEQSNCWRQSLSHASIASRAPEALQAIWINCFRSRCIRQISKGVKRFNCSSHPQNRLENKSPSFVPDLNFEKRNIVLNSKIRHRSYNYFCTSCLRSKWDKTGVGDCLRSKSGVGD